MDFKNVLIVMIVSALPCMKVLTQLAKLKNVLMINFLIY